MYAFTVMKDASWKAGKDLQGKDQVSGKAKILLWMLKINE